MAARLTDRQKKQIIADYVELGSYRAVGRKNAVAPGTVKKVVTSNTQITRKFAQKKKQNTQEMLAFMDSRKDAAQDVIDVYLKALTDPEKLSDASLAQIATAFGIVVDKFTKNTASGNDSLHKLDGLLKEFQDAVKSEAT